MICSYKNQLNSKGALDWEAMQALVKAELYSQGSENARFPIQTVLKMCKQQC